MRRFLPIVALALVWAAPAQGKGLLIPEEKTLPPLAMLNHKVSIAIEDQVAVTRVEQTFRNHTDRALEATYIFPVPKGASVNKFTMWVNGKETSGELVEAAKAREIYTSIVRRTQDPGLLEYLGNNLLRMRVFPILARADQKVALSYTSVAAGESGLVEYVYPLKTDGKATATLQEFAITATIKSEHAIQNVYSPTHAITLKRSSDREVSVQFDKNQGLLDKDFQLFYMLGDKDVGLTAMRHRPIAGENGYFLMLVSPKVELSAKYQVPRDVVFVIDTSGSMAGKKMDQAKKAVNYCLNSLRTQDRFTVLNFATTVNHYRDRLVDAARDQVDQATKWVERLETTGGTAINDALAAALALRTGDATRNFTVVFFTDGQPTIGETNPERILKSVTAKNTAGTRIFTLGIGHDVNATMLDQLSEQTRAVSSYVREDEDMEVKVSSLYGKISHPMLANLKLTAGDNVQLLEMYPPQLPDLFHGGQVVVLGRYSGTGPSAIKLTGSVGSETREFVYETTFPDKTADGRDFVEHLWARRKVGYLLDQIRANGEKKELVDEVTTLAKKYGITTPYTSWLIVPDGAVPVVGNGAARLGGFGVAQSGGRGFGGGGPAPGGVPGASGNFGNGGGLPMPTTAPAAPAALQPAGPGAKTQSVTEFAKQNQAKPGDVAANRGKFAESEFRRADLDGKEAKGEKAPGTDDALRSLREAKDKKATYEQAQEAFAKRDRTKVQAGKLGVEMSVQMNNLRNQSRLEQTALKQVYSRNCVEIGGVWIDDGFNDKMPVVAVKAQSDAYFRILERHPNIKEVYQLGNHLVWVTPNKTALVIDTSEGKEKISDEEIDKLFVTKK